jgi:glycosyltransferase involved in cell wall biosynthesis
MFILKDVDFSKLIKRNLNEKHTLLIEYLDLNGKKQKKHWRNNGKDIYLDGIKEITKARVGHDKAWKNVFKNVNNMLVKKQFLYDFDLPERNDNQIRLIYYGTLKYQENIVEIIEEFQKVHKETPEVVLKIVYEKMNGNNYFNDEVNAYMQNEIEGITIKDNLSHKDVCYEIATSDIGICRGKNEINSIRTIEYERYNLPVIKDKLMPYFNENKFLFMIPYCKVYESFIDKCVESLLEQHYKNFEIIMINDGDKSFNKTYDKTKILYYNHRYGNGPGASKYHFIKYLQDNYNDFCDETIVAILDGDDFLLTKSAVTLINLHYNINNSLMSCGNYKGKWNDAICNTKSYLSNPNIRTDSQFYFPPLRTFKIKLVNYININDFIYPERSFIKKTTDKVLFIRLIELCGNERISLIFRKIYFYREHKNCSYNTIEPVYKKKCIEYIKNLPSSSKINTFNFTKSEDQKIFIDFLKENNITHCRLSRSVSHFSRVLYIYNLYNYIDSNQDHKETNTLFFGLYQGCDFINLNNHKGKKYILYTGTDCNESFENRFNNVMAVKKDHPDAIYISISDSIFNRLTEVYTIPRTQIVSLVNDMVDYNIFYKKQINNDNSNIFIYDGNKETDELIYNKKICNEIVNKLKHKYNFVRTSDFEFSNRPTYDSMFNFYNKFFIILRLTSKDGGSETTKECKIIGKPIVHNQSDYGLKWNTSHDVINHIERISAEIKYQKNNSLNIIITEFIDKNAYNVLSLTREKLYEDNFKHILIYIDFIKNKHLLKELYYEPYWFDLKDKKSNNKEFYFNMDKFNKLVSCNNKNISKFKEIEKLFLNKNNSKLTYQINSMYNIIVKEIFKYKPYTKNKISIIIPLYNAEDTIEKTLNSVYKHDINKKINFEIIIVNDKSTDNSINIINDYIKKNKISNIIIINNKINLGTYKSRNNGVFKSTGEYLMILDSDDYLPKDRIVKDLDIMKKNQTKLCLNTRLMRYSLIDNKLIPFEKYTNYENGIYKEISVTYRRNFFEIYGFWVNNRFGSDSTLYYTNVLGKSDPSSGELIFLNKNATIYNNRLGYIAIYHNNDKECNSLTKQYDKDIRKKFLNYSFQCNLQNFPIMHSVCI